MSKSTPSANSSLRDTNAGPGINALSLVLLMLVMGSVSLRCYIRTRMTRSFGWDDAFLVLALAQAIIAVAFILLATSNGLGRHTQFIGLEKAARVVKWNTAYQIDNILGVTTVKISILILLLRLKPVRSYRNTVWTVMTIMTISNLACALFLACQCFPLQKLWRPSIRGSCAPEHAVFIVGYVQSGISVCTDLFCTLSPVVILWKVQLRTSKKAAVCLLMGLGLVATICNGLRNIYYGGLKVSDYSYGSVPILTVTLLEFLLGLLAACIPVIAPLAKKDSWTAIKGRVRSLTSAGTSILSVLQRKGRSHQIALSSRSSLDQIPLYDLNSNNVRSQSSAATSCR